MTNAQEQALKLIEEVLREHFVAGVCVVSAETEKDDEEDIRATYHGGLAAAVGLCDLGRDAVKGCKKGLDDE